MKNITLKNDTAFRSPPNQHQEVLAEDTQLEESISPSPTPSPKPLILISKDINTPTPTIQLTTQPDQKSDLSNYSNPIPSNLSSSTFTPTPDPYINYLRQLQEENTRKQEYCNNLYAEVTTSIQPLLNTRESINQNYQEAITKINTEKISYYQLQLSEVQSQINSAYKEYYAVCP